LANPRKNLTAARDAIACEESFMVNQDGVVFQKDLGPQTAVIASRVNAFDPDISWAKVEVVD
jgi:hypothetical protein